LEEWGTFGYGKQLSIAGGCRDGAEPLDNA
jgi:hypothetical protein